MKTKGQVSMELIIIIGALSIMLLFLVGLSLIKKTELTAYQEYSDQNLDCLKLSNRITEVFVGGNGTQVTDNIGYNATILPSSKSIEIKTKSLLYDVNGDGNIDPIDIGFIKARYGDTQLGIFCTIPIDQVPYVTLTTGDIKIKNVGDFILVSNI